ncbi:BatD family protein [Epilithonimonas tenax]|uniref:BatD family protein n=1 Tax=Epilithonimonas tenax TaxID=191577 RepID=UPI0004049074|nr:BatD family protein [Epilithonimonas tenax]
MIKKNLYIVFLLASAFSFAQVNLYSEVNTQDARVNSPITFTVVLEIFGEDLIQETPVKLPDLTKFEYAISSEQNTLIDPVKKIRINQMVYQFALNPRQTGTVKIGSALVKINGKIYKTEPIDIYVKEADKKPLAYNPAKNMYLNMQLEEREVYKDEPAVVILKAFSRNISSFRHLEPAKFEPTKNMAIRSIANFDESIEDSENDYSAQIVGMFVIIPKVSGVLDIPGMEVPFTNHKNVLVSNRARLNVKRLPEGAPENFKNAVGKYDVKIEMIDKSKENFEINKAFNISVKISGKGNLSPSIVPKIMPSPDYEIFEPKIINNAIATEKGIEGEVEAQYVIIPKKRGDLKITTEDFSYFDPNEEKYVELGPQFLALNAVNAQDIANAKTTLQKVNEYTNNVLEKVDSPVMSTQKLKVKEHKKISWIVILGNLLIVGLGAMLFLYFNKKIKDKKKQQLEKKKIASRPIMTIAETEALLKHHHSFDADSHFDYLKKMIQQGETSRFFQGFDELKADADAYCKTKHSLNFVDYLKSNFSLHQLEKYNQLIAKVNIEKYSPYSSKENQTEILNEIEEVYHQL